MRSHPSSWNKTLTKLGFRHRIRKRNQRIRSPRRRSSFETLETRQLLAADYTVTTLDDLAVAGTGGVGADNEWSLREALTAAAADGQSDHDIIEFSATLSGGSLDMAASEGQFIVDSDVTIRGLGQEALTIDAKQQSRVFQIDSGVNATFEDLAIQGGLSTASGGGINNFGSLILNSVRLTDNRSELNGGGVSSIGASASLSIFDSTIDTNIAADPSSTSSGAGGGVYVDGGNLLMERSSILDNDSNYYGAGIATGFSGAASFVINTSTVAGNETQFASGIAIFATLGTQISNTTVSDNTATAGAGGGIYYSGVDFSATFSNLTVTENKEGGSGDGAGIYMPSAYAVTIHNSIVAENRDLAGALKSDVSGIFAEGSTYNIVGIGNSQTLYWEDPGNQVGDLASPIAPVLAPLGNYGGPTQTHALLPGSPAIDVGNPATSGTVDQRGLSQLGTLDIGAYEAHDYSVNELVVNTLHDADVGAGELSLRQAMHLAAATPNDEVILFAPGLSGTMLLDSPLSVPFDYDAYNTPILGNVSIIGPGADLLTIDANGNSRTLYFPLLVADDISISGLKLTGATVAAVHTEGPAGTLLFDQVEISENPGRGIDMYSGGQLAITSSTIANNGGQAISTNDTDVVNVSNTTISGNQSTGSVAGLSVIFGAATVTNSTITGNRASINSQSPGTDGGAGVYASYAGQVELHNSIVSGNMSGADGFAVASDLGRMNSYYSSTSKIESNSSYNIIGAVNSHALPDLTDPSNQIDPLLDVKLTALGNFGGRTRTHALQPDSPAIDAGNDAVAASAGTLSEDQRGGARPVDIRALGSDDVNTIDIGAFELGAVDGDLSSADGRHVLLHADGDVDVFGSNSKDTIEISNSQVKFSSSEVYPVDISSASIVKVYAGNGHDTVTVNSSVGVNFEVYGEAGNDTITTSSGNDTIDGGAGNDTLNGRFGQDLLIGGANNDTFRLSNKGIADQTIEDSSGSDKIDLFPDWKRDQGTTFDLGLSQQTVFDDGTTSLVLTVSAGSVIENLKGTPFDDVLYGTNSANDIDGSFGDDIIYGRDGNDTLKGNYGRDQIFGELGDDTIDGGFGAFDIVRGGPGFDNPEVVDNEDPEFTPFPGGVDFLSEGFNGSQLTATSDSGSLSTWNFSNLSTAPADNYRVYVTWSPETVVAPSTTSEYTVRDGHGNGFSFNVDQSQQPNGPDLQDRPWYLLGTFGDVNGSLAVELNDLSLGAEIADAVRIEYIEPLSASILPPSNFHFEIPSNGGSTFGPTIGHLRWNNVSGNNGYEIQRSRNGFDGWATWVRKGTNSTSQVNYGPSTKYFFRIRTLDNETGPSVWSPVLSNVMRNGVTVASSIVTNDEDRVVQVSVDLESSQSQGHIVLQWPAMYDQLSSQFSIYRREKGFDNWALQDSGVTGTSWTDVNSSVGDAWEYKVTRSGGDIPVSGTGYIYAGLDHESASMIDSRGKVVLIVDANHVQSLVYELARLEQDLVGDGWRVLRHDIDPATQTAADVKSLIVADYNADPNNVESVLLFGDVPTVDGGGWAPDGHSRSSLETDMYYGDMDGDWSNPSSITRAPNDGDAEPIELAVGRVDMSRMTWFTDEDPTLTETELLRRYLDKDHAFRHGLFDAQRRGLVHDGFGNNRDSESTAFGNFSSMFGDSNIERRDWFGTLQDPEESYLWSYMGDFGPSSSGINLHISNAEGSSITSTRDFANKASHSVFTALFGSYILQWDTSNNLLRSVLANEGYGLTATWGQRPEIFYHHMGLGDTVGFGNLTSQNNSMSSSNGYNQNSSSFYQQGISINLQGDPTLRMHVVAPPSGLSATDVSGGISLAWAASPDTDVVGYHIYRAPSGSQAYQRLTTSAYVAGTNFTDTDSSPSTGTHQYMVRAVKIEESGSGTYHNLSQAVFSNGIELASLNFVGTSTTDTIDLSFVPYTTNEPRFQTAYEGDLNLTFDVVDSRQYALRLFFAETVQTASGTRVFDVSVEGVNQLDNYDIHDDVGHDAGIIKTFVVTAVGNQLDVDLAGVIGDPLLSAVELFEV